MYYDKTNKGRNGISNLLAHYKTLVISQLYVVLITHPLLR